MVAGDGSRISDVIRLRATFHISDILVVIDNRHIVLAVVTKYDISSLPRCHKYLRAKRLDCTLDRPIVGASGVSLVNS
jgi:hypothetical protein